MVSEVPVLRLVTQKGEMGNMGLLLWDMSIRGKLLLRWDRSSVGLCVRML